MAVVNGSDTTVAGPCRRPRLMDRDRSQSSSHYRRWIIRYFLRLPVVAVLAFSLGWLQATAQQLPQDFGFSSQTDYLLDAGYTWPQQTLQHPISSGVTSWQDDQTATVWLLRRFSRWRSQAQEMMERSRTGIGMHALPAIGIANEAGDAKRFSETALQTHMLIQFRIHEIVYGGIYSRATNQGGSLPHYTGVPRDRSRFGLDTGEFDQAYIGIEGDWYRVELGRNRQIWGPLATDNLVLSANQPAYERLAVDLSFGRWKARFFYGFLEALEADTVQGVNQRYISGRMLEYSNRRNFVVGLGEVSIMSGIDRPWDPAYLNPIALHLEVDQNNRSNASTANDNNAVWFAHLDWYLFQQLRLSGTILMDEFQLDEEDREQGRPDNLAYLGRLAWSPRMLRSTWVTSTLFTEYVRINTFTLQHFVPANNFVSRNRLLFHPIGNDADRLEVGGRLIFGWNMLLEAACGMQQRGGNSLLVNPYDGFQGEFLDGPFPSSPALENTYLRLKLHTEPITGLQLEWNGKIDLDTSTELPMERHEIVVRYYLPMVFGTNQ